MSEEMGGGAEVGVPVLFLNVCRIYLCVCGEC